MSDNLEQNTNEKETSTSQNNNWKEIIEIPEKIRTHIWTKNNKKEVYINTIKVSDKSIGFFCDEDLKHTVNYDKSNGVWLSHSSWIVVAPKCFYEVNICFEGNASVGGCTLNELKDQCMNVYLKLGHYLTFYHESDVKNLTPTNLVEQNVDFTNAVNTVQAVGLHGEVQHVVWA